ncbi:hypothetical protein GECvBN5_gp097 [Salmonella phage GEC_vB_N5]|uniref:Uncharacterized protein n=3 Tax=Markadamsvirinae TaxID=2732013 RepID=A0A7S9SS84_9CAUD|nr:hypothetical protein GECvBN3_gp100 [Salmonella phage GEC_vB_N3]QPI15113.1 hypothetical protein GECvBN5_gp097 [Salmonella phage GEC_vB_N5]QPI15542.1 hypothetical protein GECvBN7_gp099 [Salmonella phage GEC_vB_N7]
MVLKNQTIKPLVERLRGFFFCLKYRKARALGGNAGLVRRLRVAITYYAYP